MRFGTVPHAWSEASVNESLLKQILEEGERFGVQLLVHFGPLNNVVIQGSSNLQQPHKLRLQNIAQEFGYTVTFE